MCASSDASPAVRLTVINSCMSQKHALRKAIICTMCVDRETIWLIQSPKTTALMHLLWSYSNMDLVAIRCNSFGVGRQRRTRRRPRQLFRQAMANM